MRLEEQREPLLAGGHLETIVEYDHEGSPSEHRRQAAEQELCPHVPVSSRECALVNRRNEDSRKKESVPTGPPFSNLHGRSYRFMEKMSCNHDKKLMATCVEKSHTFMSVLCLY